ASTLLVWPVPLAHNCLFLANTMVLDFVCLQLLEAKIKSSNSFSEGLLLVTYVRSSRVSVLRSFSCTNTPLRQVRTLCLENSTSFRIRIILFFLPLTTSRASGA